MATPGLIGVSIFPFVFLLRIVFPGLIVPFSSRFLTIFGDNFNVSLLRKKQIEKVECAIFIEQTLQAPLLSGHVQAGIFKKYFYKKYFNILSSCNPQHSYFDLAEIRPSQK